MKVAVRERQTHLGYLAEILATETDDRASDSAEVAAALLSVLNQCATQMTITGGQLSMSFETGLTLKIDPDQRASESSQLI